MGIDQFDDRHGADQEEEDSCDLPEMAGEFFGYGMFVRRGTDVERPAKGACDEGSCGLVDVERVFEGNAEVPQNEDNKDGGFHGLRSLAVSNRQRPLECGGEGDAATG